MVLSVISEQNVILVKGAIPGPKGSNVVLKSANKATHIVNDPKVVNYLKKSSTNEEQEQASE